MSILASGFESAAIQCRAGDWLLYYDQAFYLIATFLSCLQSGISTSEFITGSGNGFLEHFLKA
jgi:hypothetical protein